LAELYQNLSAHSSFGLIKKSAVHLLKHNVTKRLSEQKTFQAEVAGKHFMSDVFPPFLTGVKRQSKNK
jgi:hypothetical protein